MYKMTNFLRNIRNGGAMHELCLSSAKENLSRKTDVLIMKRYCLFIDILFPEDCLSAPQ